MSVAHWGNGLWTVVAFIAVGRAGSIVSFAEALAFQQTRVIVSNSVQTTDWIVHIWAFLALRVVNEARSVLGPGRPLAFHDADVVIGLLVSSANRSVVPGTVNAVVFIRTLAVALAGDSAALPNTFIEVGVPVNTALGSVELRAVIAVGYVQGAQAVVGFPHSLAVEQTFVVIGKAIGSANWHVGQSLGASAIRQIAGSRGDRVGCNTRSCNEGQ
jgi:hypothetical protein